MGDLTPLRAAATLSIDRQSEDCWVRLTARSGREWRAPEPGNVGAIRKGRERLIVDLHDFKATLTSNTDLLGFVDDLEVAANALDKLHRLSMRFLWALLDPNPSEVLFDVLHQLRVDIEEAEAAGSVPLVELYCPPELVFPLEILPATELLFAPPDNRVASLAEAARYFLGFRAPTRTVLRGVRLQPKPMPPTISRQARVRYMWDALLPAAEREYTSLASLDMEVEPPTPVTNATRESFLGDLAGSLLGSSGINLDQHPDVLHLACHCTRNPPDEPPSLTFGSETDARQSEIQIGADDLRWTLQRELQRRYLEPGRTSADNRLALVFANACSSARPDPDGLTLFPGIFVDQAGAATFIGPLVDINDGVAATFSPYVYRHLLRGETVALALWAARNETLHDLRNPLGLAYATFGSADTTIPT